MCVWEINHYGESYLSHSSLNVSDRLLSNSHMHTHIDGHAKITKLCANLRVNREHSQLEDKPNGTTRAQRDPVHIRMFVWNGCSAMGSTPTRSEAPSAPAFKGSSVAERLMRPCDRSVTQQEKKNIVVPTGPFFHRREEDVGCRLCLEPNDRSRQSCCMDLRCVGSNELRLVRLWEMLFPFCALVSSRGTCHYKKYRWCCETCQKSEGLRKEVRL